MKKTVEYRFWSHVDKKGPTVKLYCEEIYPEIIGEYCYQWLAYVDRNGYGNFDSQQAHRVAYELHYGKGSLGKKQALHKCDNPGCVRWSHLFKGLHKDNMKDMQFKGRQVRGITNGQAKLTESAVTTLRNLYATGNYTQKQLSLRFGILQQTISLIVNRKFWKHI